MAAVSLVLVNGRVHEGHLSRFSPAGSDITLSLSKEGKEKSRFATEQVAYVGFHRPTNEPPPLPHKLKAELKIHVGGGKTFLVDLDAPDTPGSIGFYARPAEPQSAFREIFFYNHGVNLRELNLPLGELLVKEGLTTAALETGLAKQKSEQRTPIGQILLETKRVNANALEQAASLQKRKGTRIGEVLIEAGLAKSEDIEFALSEQRKRGGKRIGQILVDLKVITEVQLAVALARKFQLPFVDLDTVSINLEAVVELDRAFIEKHRVLPVDGDARSITVAMSDPLAVDTLDQVRLHTKRQLSEVVVTKSQLDKYIPTYLDQVDSRKRENEMDEIMKGLTTGDAKAEAEVEEVVETTTVKESDNAIIKLANQIIIDAYRRGASDIHIEPNGRERTTGVRFRIDGDCSTYQDIPATYRMPLVARLKIMAQLDVTERRKPQDGKIRFRVGERQIELRVATIPTANGNEDVVLRILAGSKPLPLDQMGLGPRNLAELRRIITAPHGLILCVGPTGSGKTTTLHSALGSINTVDMKIWTAEDPVEITQPGLRQVQVNAKIGFTFAAAMRAFLRADPDVIMVGEMRDAETASTGIEASLTGHLVLSTLHTNSAPETVTRLIDMGLDPFSFADALLGVIAQRLARGLCKQCREPYTATPEQGEELAQAYGPEAFRELVQRMDGSELRLWRAVGCNACNRSGYKGRVAIHELLVSDGHIKTAIQRKAPVAEIRQLAIANGMTTLLQDGIEKILSGQTDQKQVLAVCGGPAH